MNDDKIFKKLDAISEAWADLKAQVEALQAALVKKAVILDAEVAAELPVGELQAKG